MSEDVHSVLNMMRTRRNFSDLLDQCNDIDLSDVKEISLDVFNNYKNQLMIEGRHKSYNDLFIADLAYKPITDDIWYCLKDRYGHIGAGVKFRVIKDRVKSEFFKDEDLMIVNTKEINYECNRIE